MSRKEGLIELRNKKIKERFVYLSEVKRLRTDDIFRTLSREEFFLSEKTIEMILKDQGCYMPKQKQLQINFNND